MGNESTTELPEPSAIPVAATQDKIAEKVRAYRKLSMQAEWLETQMEALRAEVLALVEAYGAWKDSDGYAKLVDKASYPSYKSADVEALAATWAQSDDPIMKSCGQMLLAKRSMSKGSHYVQIK